MKDSGLGERVALVTREKAITAPRRIRVFWRPSYAIHPPWCRQTRGPRPPAAESSSKRPARRSSIATAKGR